MLARVADVLFGTWQWCFLDWQKVFWAMELAGRPIGLHCCCVVSPIAH